MGRWCVELFKSNCLKCVLFRWQSYISIILQLLLSLVNGIFFYDQLPISFKYFINGGCVFLNLHIAALVIYTNGLTTGQHNATFSIILVNWVLIALKCTANEQLRRIQFCQKTRFSNILLKNYPNPSSHAEVHIEKNILSQICVVRLFILTPRVLHCFA